MELNNTQYGYDIPTVELPKSLIAFSKPKQDVWVRLVLAMNGQQEPVRYKAIDYLD